jgi:hypothetical protein
MNDEYLTRAGLKARGWSDWMVTHLGVPDEPAPHEGCGSPVELFLMSRVVAVERTTEWKQAAAELVVAKWTAAAIGRAVSVGGQADTHGG